MYGGKGFRVTKIVHLFATVRPAQCRGSTRLGSVLTEGSGTQTPSSPFLLVCPPQALWQNEDLVYHIIRKWRMAALLYNYAVCFQPKSENFEFAKKAMPSERASQEEQVGANLIFIAPSSEELWVRKLLTYAVIYISLIRIYLARTWMGQSVLGLGALEAARSEQQTW